MVPIIPCASEKLLGSGFIVNISAFPGNKIAKIASANFGNARWCRIKEDRKVELKGELIPIVTLCASTERKTPVDENPLIFLILESEMISDDEFFF